MSELDELRQKASKKYEAQKARLRELYAYAREKGFTAQEAAVLQGSSKEKIDRLAKLRDSNKGGK